LVKIGWRRINDTRLKFSSNIFAKVHSTFFTFMRNAGNKSQINFFVAEYAFADWDNPIGNGLSYLSFVES
jgi:hypothetical protein